MGRAGAERQRTREEGGWADVLQWTVGGSSRPGQGWREGEVLEEDGTIATGRRKVCGKRRGRSINTGERWGGIRLLSGPGVSN